MRTMLPCALPSVLSPMPIRHHRTDRANRCNRRYRPAGSKRCYWCDWRVWRHRSCRANRTYGADRCGWPSGSYWGYWGDRRIWRHWRTGCYRRHGCYWSHRRNRGDRSNRCRRRYRADWPQWGNWTYGADRAYRTQRSNRSDRCHRTEWTDRSQRTNRSYWTNRSNWSDRRDRPSGNPRSGCCRPALYCRIVRRYHNSKQPTGLIKKRRRHPFLAKSLPLNQRKAFLFAEFLLPYWKLLFRSATPRTLFFMPLYRLADYNITGDFDLLQGTGSRTAFPLFFYAPDEH